MSNNKENNGYYISRYGLIRSYGFQDVPFDTESFGLENWFPTRQSALTVRDIMEQNKPRIFLCQKRKIK